MQKSEGLQILERKIAACIKCKELVEYRQTYQWKTVPGVGNPNARIMVIGEAPGENEAKQGEPFVGKAGKLLTTILEKAGMPRETVFITNILKCRPPGNRDPMKEEADNCRKFLDLQITCIDPEWILCFGRIASVFLLDCPPDTSMGDMRGQHFYEDKKVICTYHPSYALRQPSAKAEIWADLQPLLKSRSFLHT